MPQLNRIAYVEDEPDIRELTEIALMAVGGLEVRSFPSGQQALDGLQGAAPDLLLLDVMMPGMDGPEVRRRAREMAGLEGVPAIFMTAKSRPSEVEDLMRLDVLGVISKPYDPMTLAEEIRALWDGARG